jgi:hypothetical protein
MYIERLASSAPSPIPDILQAYPRYFELTQSATGTESATIDSIAAPLDTTQVLVRDVHSADMEKQNGATLQALGRHSAAIIMSEMLDTALGDTAKNYLFYANGQSGVLTAVGEGDKQELYIVTPDNRVDGGGEKPIYNPLDRAPLSTSLLGALTVKQVVADIERDGRTALKLDPNALLHARTRFTWATYAERDELPLLEGYPDRGASGEEPYYDWNGRDAVTRTSMVMNIYEAATGRAALRAESEFAAALAAGDAQEAALILEVYGDDWPSLDARAPHSDIIKLVGLFCEQGEPLKALASIGDYCSRFKHFGDPRFKGLEADLYLKVAKVNKNSSAAAFAMRTYRQALDLSPRTSQGTFRYPQAAVKWETRLSRSEALYDSLLSRESRRKGLTQSGQQSSTVQLDPA